jgi:hypothetical protein
VSGDEVCSFSNTVNYYDYIIAMSLWELDNEVDADNVLSVCWSLCRVEFSIISTKLQLSLIV